MESNLKQAVEELEQTKTIVLPLLKDIPSLQVRVETTINRLIAGFKNLDTMGNSSSENSDKLPQMKTFMGNTIGENKIATVKPVSKSDVEDLLEKAKKIYGTIIDRENKEILEAVPDVELRAVAKLAGLNWVTSAKPAKLDMAFVDKIKAGITQKEDLAKEQELESKSIILKDLKFVHDTTAQTWTLGDRVVTKEQILNDEFFDELIAAVKPE